MVASYLLLACLFLRGVASKYLLRLLSLVVSKNMRSKPNPTFLFLLASERQGAALLYHHSPSRCSAPFQKSNQPPGTTYRPGAGPAAVRRLLKFERTRDATRPPWYKAPSNCNRG